MNRTKTPLWIWAAILVPALISLYGVVQRHRVESRNKAVSIATELDTIESLAAAQGLTTEEGVKHLKMQGLNAVVLPEETVGELITRGEATLVTTFIPNAVGPEGSVVTSLRFDDPRQIARVQRGLRIRFGALAANLPVRDHRLLLPAVASPLIRGTAIGINPVEAAFARKMNLVVIARHGNPVGISGAAIRDTLAWSKELGATVYLPQGEQVLGRRDAVGTTTSALKELGMLFASVEFGKIGGEANILHAAPELVVRLHSAQAAELDKLPMIDAVERYGKAARERNMRILLVRPLSNAAEKPLDEFGEFVSAIETQVRAEGGTIAPPHPFGDTSFPRLYSILLGLSIVPAGVFVLQALMSNRKLFLAGSGLLTLLGLACAVHIGQEFMALSASLIFPLLGFILLDQLKPKHAVVGFWLVTGVSLVAGLAIVGLLNGRPYFIGADQPFGTKIGLFLPVLLVGGYFVLRLTNIREVLRNPITWGAAGLSLVVLVVLLMLVARSGNDTGAGASDLEIVFRNLLDRFLYVRPRTKEFLIGHPAMVVGAGMLGLIQRRPELREKLGGWAALMLMMGAVGQTGAVNTLWHLHIPVLLSLVRIVEGAVIGCIIGLGLWAVVSRVLPRQEGS